MGVSNNNRKDTMCGSCNQMLISTHCCKKACFKFFYKKIGFLRCRETYWIGKTAADQGLGYGHKTTLGRPYLILIKTIRTSSVLDANSLIIIYN